MSDFPRLDILPAAQCTLWPKLAEVRRHSFVLYGGTAVALYLGHRESVDFDFFTHQTFQPEELFASYVKCWMERCLWRRSTIFLPTN